MCKNQKGALLIMTDRATVHTKLHMLENRNGSMVSKTIIKRLAKSKHPVHTITFYNDKGFANHMRVANALKADTYFTRLYTSQDKGKLKIGLGKEDFFSLKRLILYCKNI